jgi:CheY-like chemotaxis protein
LSSNVPRALYGRILVADDLPDAVNSLALLCELYGAEVRQAFNGIEAVEIAGSFQPQVVLMDISMPGMNGYEAARAIRAAEWGKSMVLIALTGWGRPADLDAAREAGFDGHLLKPVHPERLLKLIASLQTRPDQY